MNDQKVYVIIKDIDRFATRVHKVELDRKHVLETFEQVIRMNKQQKEDYIDDSIDACENDVLLNIVLGDTYSDDISDSSIHRRFDNIITEKDFGIFCEEFTMGVSCKSFDQCKIIIFNLEEENE